MKSRTSRQTRFTLINGERELNGQREIFPETVRSVSTRIFSSLSLFFLQARELKNDRGFFSGRLWGRKFLLLFLLFLLLLLLHVENVAKWVCRWVLTDTGHVLATSSGLSLFPRRLWNILSSQTTAAAVLNKLLGPVCATRFQNLPHSSFRCSVIRVVCSHSNILLSFLTKFLRILECNNYSISSPLFHFIYI